MSANIATANYTRSESMYADESVVSITHKQAMSLMHGRSCMSPATHHLAADVAEK